MSAVKQVSTVGDMRAALKGYPPGTPLLNQAVFKESGLVYYGLLSVGEVIGAVPTKLGVSVEIPRTVGAPRLFERQCNRCNKVVKSSEPILATVVYCSVECAD